MKNKKNNMYLLMIISLSCFVISVLSASFAYLSLVTKHNESLSNPTIIEKDSYLLTTFDGSSFIDEKNIMPGWSKKIIFRVKNITESVNLPSFYYIRLESEGLKELNENFVFSLSGISNGSEEDTLLDFGETMYPITDSLLGIGKLKPGITHTYVLKVTYKNNNNEPLDSFKGNLVIKSK